MIEKKIGPITALVDEVQTAAYYLRFQGVAHYLGRFDTLAEAAVARKNAEHQYFDRFLDAYEKGQEFAAKANKKAKITRTETSATAAP